MRKHFNKGYIYVFIAGCLWGTLGLFVNFLGGYGISGATVVFLRMSTATLWIIPVILATGGTRLLQIDGKGLLVCAVLGIVCQALFNYAYTEAISSIGIATAAVLLYTSPVFVSIMSRIFFKETIGARKVAGLFINIVGCALTVTGGNLGTVDFLGYGVLIGIAAVGHAAMGMPPGFGAALQGAERPAVVVADAAFVGVAAVSDAIVDMPPGGGAARCLADGDGGIGGLGGADGPPAVAAAAVMAMGGGGQRQKRQGQDAEEYLFEFHERRPPIIQGCCLYHSTAAPAWQGVPCSKILQTSFSKF